MSDFKARMHLIRFRFGSVPDPSGAVHSSPQAIGGFKEGWERAREIGRDESDIY